MLTVPGREPLRPLRENLEGVTPRLEHHSEHLFDEAVGNLLMEKVAHRVHEDHSRSLPPTRRVEAARPQPQVETLLFFFQAEDGIRDFNVTGVQTCALPI